MYARALVGLDKALGPGHTLTIKVTRRLSTLRKDSKGSTCLDDVADDETTVSKCSNARRSHDVTLLSVPPTTLELASRVEQEKHHPRKRDAFFRNLVFARRY
jgi:hypothetical protein